MYRAKMKHNATTITKLVQTQYDTFQFKNKLVQVLVGFGLILFGLFAPKEWFMPWIALFVGCVMLANLNLVPKRQSKQILSQMGKNFPKSDYTFSDDGFTFYDKGDRISYKSLIRLVEDGQYAYLYVSQMSAYMVDKRTITGGTVEQWKAFLADRSDLSWSRPASLLTFRFKDLFPKKEREYTGPRLGKH